MSECGTGLVTPAETEPGTGLRDQLSSAQGLLVLSMLMTESGEEREILRLAATAVPSLSRCRLLGVYLVENEPGSFSNGTFSGLAPPEEDVIVKAQLAVVGTAGGPVAPAGTAWGWAYPLRSLGGNFGYLVAAADEPPGAHEQFLLRVLAQQAGIALANVRSHQRERETASALRAANATLAETVAALERSTVIHDRLTQVAGAGEGQEGIAHALHELTGFAVAIEDRHGNLVTWAGPGRPEPYPKDPAERREELLRQMKAGAPVRHKGSLMCIAHPRPDVTGLIALFDPEERCGAAEQVALEHGATVLAMELARAHSIAEAELRLGRDLADDLLGGSDEAVCMTRAHALGYDLSRPHRVVVVSFLRGASDAHSDDDADSGNIADSDNTAENMDRLFQAVRRAARDTGVQGLQVARQGTVVLPCGADGDWQDFRLAIDREMGDKDSRVGVGGRCERPSAFARSYREAKLALSIASGGGRDDDRVTVFDDLGLLRVLLSMEDTTALEYFVRAALGPVLDYDAKKGSTLVSTLGSFLEHGGNYETTSRALSVHRSTLKYRLHRIEELSGHDLSVPEVRFDLQLAGRAWQSLWAGAKRPLNSLGN